MSNKPTYMSAAKQLVMSRNPHSDVMRATFELLCDLLENAASTARQAGDAMASGELDLVNWYAHYLERLLADCYALHSPITSRGHYWDERSNCRCDACNATGTVKGFQVPEDGGAR